MCLWDLKSDITFKVCLCVSHGTLTPELTSTVEFVTGHDIICFMAKLKVLYEIW